MIAAVLFLSSFAVSAAQRTISEKDLWHIVWVGDPQVSPDGSRAVFTRIVTDKKHLGYETSLWTVATRGGEPPQRLTSGTHDAQPRWSPDGRSIAFLRASEKDGKPQPPQLFILSMSGGEPVQVTDLPKGATDPRWAPDGKRIAFASSTSPEDLKKKAKQPGNEPASATPPQGQPPEPGRTTPESASTKPSGQEGREPLPTDEDGEHESDVKVVTRAVFRVNGQGYLDFTHPSHLWVVAPTGTDEKAQPKQITSGKFDEEEFFWSNDGEQLVYTTVRSEEPYYQLPHTDIYSVPAAGGEPKLVNAVKLGVSELSPSPDGKRIAFRGQINEPIRSYQEPDLFVLDLSPGAQPRNLTADFDYDVGGGIIADCMPPRAAGDSRPLWTADGKDLVDVVSIKGRANLMRFPVDGGKPAPITQGDQTIQRFALNARGDTLVALVSTPIVVGDLVAVGERGQLARLTSFNDKLFSQLDLTQPEELWYTSFDGKKIQAWVQKPPHFDAKKKYPLILNIHGGPHAAYGWAFDHEFQWMAARGYVVLYPNPRGSTSYGQEFGNVIQYKYPGDDYKDLMAGVDELLKRGYVDEKKLGVTGGSGGGVLTNWTVTHTDRFRAAVSQRDISDWAAWWYTDDFWLYRENWFKKPPFKDPKEYADRSSLTLVEKIHTPIAFILGDADWRTPPGAGGEALFRALKYLKRPTAMVRFPGESHELSRSGQPWHRVERLEAIVGWFDKFMLGQDVELFRDVARPGEGERRAANQ